MLERKLTPPIIKTANKRNILILLIFIFLLSCFIPKISYPQIDFETGYHKYRNSSNNFYELDHVVRRDTIQYRFFAERRAKHHKLFDRTESDSSYILNFDYNFPHFTLSFDCRSENSEDRTGNSVSFSTREIATEAIIFKPYDFIKIKKNYSQLDDNFRNKTDTLRVIDNSGYQNGFFVDLDYNIGDNFVVYANYSDQETRQSITDNDSSQIHFNLKYKRRKPRTTNFYLDFYELDQTEQRQRSNGIETKFTNQRHLEGELEIFPVKHLEMEFTGIFYEDNVQYESDGNLSFSNNDKKKDGKSIHMDFSYKMFDRKLMFRGTAYRKKETTRYKRYMDDHSAEERKFRIHVTYIINPKSQITFSRQLDLTRYEYFDWRNIYDRDQFYDRINFGINYQFSSKFDMSVDFSTKETRLIYIESEKSSSNKQSNTYFLSPSLTYTPTENLSFQQTYQLNADYTVYDFNDDANMLYRKFQMENSVEYSFHDPIQKMDKFDLGIAHILKMKDQGGYDYSHIQNEWIYHRNSEETNNTIEAFFQWMVTQTLSCRARYNVELIHQSDFFPEHEERFRRQRYELSVRGNIENFAIQSKIAKIYEEKGKEYWAIDARTAYHF